MDALACRAGVGKGTVFRRFGSREGLMGALLNHSETEWQAAVMGGPPPLGPDAPPMERLLAFGESRMLLNLRHAELIEAAGNPGARSAGRRSFTTMHVRYLLGRLGVTGDLSYLATALVAPLEIIVLREQVDRAHVPMDRLVAGWSDLVRRVTRPRRLITRRGAAPARRSGRRPAPPTTPRSRWRRRRRSPTTTRRRWSR